MGEQALWAVLIGASGDEQARIAIADVPERGTLPLRRVAEEGLKQNAAAVILVRPARDADCTPCTQEEGAIRTAHKTLDAIGLRLHDYILWHGERCVSLRRTGRL